MSHILKRKIGNFDDKDFKYTLLLIFLIEKEVSLIGLISSICCILYFEWENKYLQMAKPKVYFSGKTDIYN